MSDAIPIGAHVVVETDREREILNNVVGAIAAFKPVAIAYVLFGADGRASVGYSSAENLPLQVMSAGAMLTARGVELAKGGD